MLHRFRRIKEPYRMLLIGCLTVMVLVVGSCWPSIETALWVTFLGTMALTLYLDLREPVNYKSLEFDTRGFRFAGIGDAHDVKWCEITDVFYQRNFEPFGNQIETEWEFHLGSGATVMVLVEWPHRTQFARAIVENLDIVSKEKVNEVRRIRMEGRWRCIDA